MDMFFEVSSTDCKLLSDMDKTLKECKLEDGDIIIFQRIALEQAQPCKYVNSRTVVTNSFLCDDFFIRTYTES